MYWICSWYDNYSRSGLISLKGIVYPFLKCCGLYSQSPVWPSSFFCFSESSDQDKLRLTNMEKVVSVGNGKLKYGFHGHKYWTALQYRLWHWEFVDEVMNMDSHNLCTRRSEEWSEETRVAHFWKGINIALLQLGCRDVSQEKPC